ISFEDVTITASSVKKEVKRRRSLNSEQEETVVKKEAKLGKLSESYLVSSPKDNVHWAQHDSVLIGRYMTSKDGKNESNPKVAGFDMDGTLISVKGTHKYPKDEHDWKWWSKKVPKRLKELDAEGYRIIIISNQGGLDLSKKNSEKRRTNFINKIKHIADDLNVPFVIYVATGRDKYRKPMAGIWKCLIENENNCFVDMEKSFYVGDAAGREDNWKKGAQRDWADTDRKFAENIGLKFYTPEEFFDNEKLAPFSYSEGFDPKKLPQDVPLFAPTSPPLVVPKEQCEVVIFTGFPASGKSTFANKWLINNGYTHVNQDKMKTKAKCIKACEEALEEKKSVVIDSTNSNAESRKDYIDIAKKYGVPVRCFWFQASEALAKHNNMYRVYGATGLGRTLLPDISFQVYKSKFSEPTLDEGFQEIKLINFIFEGNEEERKKYEMWYI
ncbi:12756_t:CDS:10, partial [Acaulospora morrowiae]